MHGWVFLAIAAGALGGCIEVVLTAEDDGLRGSRAQFDAMTPPCLDEAARLSGVPADAVLVTDRRRTGGGPVLTLAAGDDTYTCRLADDGSVAVFSAHAT